MMPTDWCPPAHQAEAGAESEARAARPSRKLRIFIPETTTIAPAPPVLAELIKSREALVEDGELLPAAEVEMPPLERVDLEAL